MKRAALCFTLAVLVTGCSSISVNSDYNPDTDFSQYSTYMWIDTEGEAGDSLTNDRVEAALDRAMQERGFEKVTSGADLALGYQLSTDQRTSYTTMSTGWGGYRWGGWYGGMGVSSSTTTQNNYEVGTLLVGLFEVSTEELVWTGSASATVKENQTPQGRTQRINDAVDKMMAGFPPGQ